MTNSDLSFIFSDFFQNHLLKAKLSNSKTRSSDIPFFNTISHKSNLRNISLKKRDIPLINNKLNRNIKEIYKYTENDDQEIYLYNWTFMSINEILERYQFLCEKRNDIIDIAYKYKGMGWISVLSCDLNNSLLFERLDGGSNIFDRQDNLQNIINDGSKFFEKLYFSQWVKNISQDIYE